MVFYSRGWWYWRLSLNGPSPLDHHLPTLVHSSPLLPTLLHSATLTLHCIYTSLHCLELSTLYSVRTRIHTQRGLGHYVHMLAAGPIYTVYRHTSYGYLSSFSSLSLNAEYPPRSINSLYALVKKLLWGLPSITQLPKSIILIHLVV